MEEKLKELYEKASSKFFALTSKFDGISDKIYEQTNVKINIGLIFGSIILILFVFIIVKAVLGFVWSFLWA